LQGANRTADARGVQVRFDQKQNFVLETLLNDARAAALLSRYFVILTEINAWASRAILVLRR
jgi:hypothetical protein